MLLDEFLCMHSDFALFPFLIMYFQNVEVEEEQHVDERSVDDLLSFINGEDEGKIKT